MSSVGCRLLETNKEGNIQGGSSEWRGSGDRGVGGEARTVSFGKRGESKYLKSLLRVKEGTILYVQRAAQVRGK